MKTTEESTIQIENIEAYGLSIYPNPFNGNVKVNAKESIKKVYLMNLQGKTLYEKEMNAKEKEFTFENLREGVYFLKIEYSDGVKEIRKMIKK